jgi:hypothetical protein
MSLEDLAVQVVVVVVIMLEASVSTTWASRVVLVHQMPLVAVVAVQV